ncbi:hypothetical protein ONZ45_g1110 [Pleurotus djamor]|nr:hypothetical protein ONZ45_g1110 [Pleurotus djamor]
MKQVLFTLLSTTRSDAAFRLKSMSLAEELTGRVQVDSEQVLHRLRIDDVPNKFVTVFLKHFKHRNNYSITALKELVADAYEWQHDPSKDMLPYLQAILDDITHFDALSARRHFYCTEITNAEDESDISHFPFVNPDFRCGDPVEPGQPHTWRSTESFIHVQPTRPQRLIPKNFNPEEAAETLAQTADYARLHLSSLPFQLFSVSVIISGSRFLVAIFDREGATVTSDFHLWKQTEIFVRVIRQIACGLSSVDPSVQELEDTSTILAEIRKNQLQRNSPVWSVQYPSFLITCPLERRTRPEQSFNTASEPVSNQWATIGPPIWSSLSLCGRATSVWRVTRVMDGEIVNIDAISTLKNSWRRSDCKSETQIYQNLATHPVGVAEFLQGGNVVIPGSTDVIRVDHLRTLSNKPFVSGTQGTWILHRLILNPAGRALWEGDSFLDIVKGVRAALNDHQRLFNQNILHRDVNPGTVLLFSGPSVKPGEEGFLTNLELAIIPTMEQDTHGNISNNHVHQSQGSDLDDSKYDVEMPGNLQFMAIALVKGLAHSLYVPHQLQHDVESFIWVFAYSVARHAIFDLRADSEKFKFRLSGR